MSVNSDADPKYIGSIIAPARPDVYGDSTIFTTIDFVDTHDEFGSIFITIFDGVEEKAKVEINMTEFLGALTGMAEDLRVIINTDQMIAEIEEELNGDNETGA